MTLTVGSSLQNGKYLIQAIQDYRELEVTYQATHSLLGQTVTLKTLNDNLRSHSDFDALKQQLLTAASHLARCQHPNLVRALDCFEEDGMPYVALESLSGQSLAEVVRTDRPLPEDTAILYIRQIGAAVEHIHQQGWVHGGIGAQAIFRSYGTDHVTLAGIGVNTLHLAPPPAPAEDAEPASDPELAALFTAAATVTPASDLRAIAHTLYFLLTGHLPSAMSSVDWEILRQAQPHLQTSTEEALRLAMGITDPLAASVSLATWLKTLSAASTSQITTLPEAPSNGTVSSAPAVNGAGTNAGDALTQLGNPSAETVMPPSLTYMKTQVVSPGSPQPQTELAQVRRSRPVTPSYYQPSGSKKRPWLLVGLGVTAIAAACSGAYLGFNARYQPDSNLSTSPIFGREIFGGKQNFDPSDNWPGVDSTELDSSPRVLFERSGEPSRDDTYESEDLQPLPPLTDDSEFSLEDPALNPDSDPIFDPESVSGTVTPWDSASPPETTSSPEPLDPLIPPDESSEVPTTPPPVIKPAPAEPESEESAPSAESSPSAPTTNLLPSPNSASTDL